MRIMYLGCIVAKGDSKADSELAMRLYSALGNYIHVVQSAWCISKWLAKQALLN